MSDTGDKQRAILTELAHLLSDVASRLLQAQQVLQRSTTSDDVVRRTADFLRLHGTRLEAALGDTKSNALLELLGALASTQARTRTDAIEALTRLQALLHQGEVLVAGLLQPPTGECAPRAPQGEVLA
jgi:hypothetical protein